MDDFFNGKADKLKVVDLGPYVYHETAEKVNVSYHGNGTITYKVSIFYEYAISTLFITQLHDQADTIPYQKPSSQKAYSAVLKHYI